MAHKDVSGLTNKITGIRMKSKAIDSHFKNYIARHGVRNPVYDANFLEDLKYMAERLSESGQELSKFVDKIVEGLECN